MVTDLQTNKPTDRTDYNTLRRSFASAQCKYSVITNIIVVVQGDIKMQFYFWMLLHVTSELCTFNASHTPITLQLTVYVRRQ